MPIVLDARIAAHTDTGRAQLAVLKVDALSPTAFGGRTRRVGLHAAPLVERTPLIKSPRVGFVFFRSVNGELTVLEDDIRVAWSEHC